MSDIATRYMKLVEKRPELAVVGLVRETQRVPSPSGYEDCVVWSLHGQGCVDSVGHALIFAKLVEALPDSYGLFSVRGNWQAGEPRNGLIRQDKTPLLALLSHWESVVEEDEES